MKFTLDKYPLFLTFSGGRGHLHKRVRPAGVLCTVYSGVQTVGSLCTLCTTGSINKGNFDFTMV